MKARVTEVLCNFSALIIDKFATLDNSNEWLSKLVSFLIWLNHHQCKLQIINGNEKISILNFPKVQIGCRKVQTDLFCIDESKLDASFPRCPVSHRIFSVPSILARPRQKW